MTAKKPSAGELKLQQGVAGLRSPGEAERVAALDRVMSLLMGETNLKPLAARAPPLVIASTMEPGAPARHTPLSLLHQLLTYDGAIDLATKGRDLSDAERRQQFSKSVAGGVYAATLAELDRLVALLADGEPRVRSAAAIVLALLYDGAAAAIAPVRAVAARETDEHARAIELVALGMLGRYLATTDDVTMLDGLLATSASVAVRGGCAVALFHLDPGALTPDALRALQALVTLPHVTGFVWPLGGAWMLAPKLLTSLGPRGKAQAAEALVAAIVHAAARKPRDGRDARWLTDALDLYFERRSWSQGWMQPDGLTTEQRHLIEALSQVEVPGPFRDYGLPEQAEWRLRLLAGERLP